MAIPDFILALRHKIGTDPLWLSGVTAVVCREDQVLLVRRADTGVWTPVTGIIDPGEQPADAAVREVHEETDVEAVPERLVMVHVTEPVVYANGDQARYLDLVFRMRWARGTPHPADGENSDARWFGVDGCPRCPRHDRSDHGRPGRQARCPLPRHDVRLLRGGTRTSRTGRRPDCAGGRRDRAADRPGAGELGQPGSGSRRRRRGGPSPTCVPAGSTGAASRCTAWSVARAGRRSSASPAAAAAADR